MVLEQAFGNVREVFTKVCGKGTNGTGKVFIPGRMVSDTKELFKTISGRVSALTVGLAESVMKGTGSITSGTVSEHCMIEMAISVIKESGRMTNL